MKALIYCRVSKQEQNPKNQEIALRRYAESKSWHIDAIYTDVITGKSSSRPELMRMLSRIRDKSLPKIDVVLVWKLDRLGRSVKHLLQVVEELGNKGIDFICITQEAIDTTTATGKFTFYLLSAVAELERELISERTKAGFYTDKDGVIRSVGKNKLVGRPKGSKDLEPRKKRGYYLRDYKKRRSPIYSGRKNEV